MVPLTPADLGSPGAEDPIRIEGAAGAYGPGTVLTGRSSGRAGVSRGGPSGLTR